MAAKIKEKQADIMDLQTSLIGEPSQTITEEIDGVIVETVDLTDEKVKIVDLTIDPEYDGYKFRFDKFEGPLDALLNMIKSAKIRIEDIFVSDITEQFIGMCEEFKKMDLERASEFIEMAAWLLEIKSKSLLPKPKEEIEENDPKRELIQKLQEYQLYKEASQKMKEQETVGIHYRNPSDIVGEARFVLKDMTMDGLMKALQKLFLRLDEKSIVKKERKIMLDRFSVSDKISHIKDLMLYKEHARFDELFDEDYTKSEIITTFQALLELLKMQYIKAEQAEIFGEILLHRIDC